MTAWLLAAAALLVASALLVRMGLVARAAKADAKDADLSKARQALADAALRGGAVGAIARTPEGEVLKVGRVPKALEDGFLGAGEAASIAKDLQNGEVFRLPLKDGEGVAASRYDGPLPAVFLESTGPQRASADTAARLERLVAGAPHAAWVEGVDGTRLWENAAYAKAVGAPSHPSGAPEPLLDANAAAQVAGQADGGFREQVATIVGGERRVLDVVAERVDGALAAMALDVTDVANALSGKDRALQSHAVTLDRLGTAIAIFGPDRRLAFHNAAFGTLFQLPTAFLEQSPPEERVLDRLRADRRLPETADFKAWKREQLKGYETREGFESWWHLPDGQTLRVVANPGSDGGVTYVYENVTEQLALERRYNALSRTQGETIDNLGEGVASFGPDGLLRLANPAFWALSGVSSAEVGTHVRTLAVGAPEETAMVWAALTQQVTGLTDHRTAIHDRLERADQRVLDYAFSPLPDGSTLATFADITDSVNVERALTERNTALEAADRLKNAFIEHISYELRSPLNTIIGFTQLLNRAETGPLTDRQREYANYITTSSEALLVIIDGILDLATIDAGIMELSLAPVDVAKSVHHVLDGLKDRIAEAAIDIELSVDPDAGVFEGDVQRVRQVLFNLLSNALSHSPQGGCISISSRREGDTVAIAVRDRGSGIAAENKEAIFERFMTTGAQGRRGGVGLGLSLVRSFVGLHGGSVDVATVDGPGAQVVVRFPRHAAHEVQDAA
ncbi:MAG: ATP-binding protein [Pseudomonadota bacterium]